MFRTDGIGVDDTWISICFAQEAQELMKHGSSVCFAQAAQELMTHRLSKCFAHEAQELMTLGLSIWFAQETQELMTDGLVIISNNEVAIKKIITVFQFSMFLENTCCSYTRMFTPMNVLFNKFYQWKSVFYFLILKRTKRTEISNGVV